MLIKFILLLLFNITFAKTLRYKEIESDIRLSESLYDELYKGNHIHRRLGSVGDDDSIKLWRNNFTNGQFIIPVTLLEDDIEEGENSLTTQTSGEIFDALELMAGKLGNIIKFVRYDNINPKPVSYIKIGNFGSGCWSYIGRIPDEFQPQALNIGFGCLFTDTIEHEMMHALGFFHEQARPDRDSHVTIHWDNINPEKYFNFETALEINSRGSPYDYRSIMHYTSTAFALDPQFPSISINNEELDVSLGSAVTMTDIDQLQIRMLYRCEDSIRNVGGNCILSCPCRLNEGNCTTSDQCSGLLSCVESICIDINATASPTVSPISGSPTSSPTTSNPTVSPTHAVTIGVDTTNPPTLPVIIGENSSILIGLGIVVTFFGGILFFHLI